MHTDAVCALLGKDLYVTRGPLTRAELLDTVGNYHAIFARLGHSLDADLFLRAQSLRVIATPTTGLTHIDVDAAAALGIDILSLREERKFLEDLPATAELTWTLLLAVIRRLTHASGHTRAGSWNRDLFRGTELAGKTLGIIGLGRIGKMVARYAIAFGMNVIAFDKTKSDTGSLPVRLVDKLSLLSASDVITIHAHFNQGEPPLLDAADFEVIKPGCIMINTSRGELLDEVALLRSVLSGQLAGVGLDVLVGEPHVNRELLRLQETFNVVITPHIGGATIESIMKTELFMADKLCKYIESARDGR
jgi:D-3-phosphoglycerate dehydrogenase